MPWFSGILGESGDHGSTYQGEVSVLGRLDMVRITAVSLSYCAGAPTSMWHRLLWLRHAHLPCTSCTSPRWSLSTMTTLRSAHVWTGRRACSSAAHCSTWHSGQEWGEASPARPLPAWRHSLPRERRYGIPG